MRDVFSEAKARVSRSWIESTFGSPGAHWDGPNFKTLNPVRPDSSLGSFSIHEEGKFFDFATGEGGDVFDLLAVMSGRHPADIAREMAGGDGDGHHASAPSPSPRGPGSPPPRPVMAWKPIPEGYEPSFSTPPSFLTLYHDRDWEAGLFYVARREGVNGGKKEIFPIYHDGAVWHKGLPPGIDYRPLLKFDCTKTVVVVEGEKCAAVAARHLQNYAVTTWHGGAGAIRKVDASKLEGCDVILWPDNDDPGLLAMRAIRDMVSGKAARLRMVTIPEGKPKGWDIADAIEERFDFKTALEAAEDLPLGEPAPPAPDEASPDRNLTDLGNAERFVDMFGSSAKYNIEKCKWIIWNGKRWDDSDQSAVSPMVKAVIQSIRDNDDKGSLVFAHQCESSGRITAMLSLASMEPGIPVSETSLDPNPFDLNTPDGIIDLRTGTMRPHEKDALCSRITRVAPDGSGCPRFMKFLDEIMLGKEEYIEFLQRWFGYAATGDVSAQTFTIFYGNGANGKSTLMELIMRIMGTYSRTAPPDTFTMKPNGGGIPNDIAALRGARLVAATETESGARLAESRVKMMTGGERISARYMRGEFFEFDPSWKIAISTNHRPRISGADYGIWRRIVLVPFEFCAQGDRLDPGLPQKLWMEAPGILSWIVEGARKWAADGMGRKGLKVSASLLQETQEYREDEDLVGQFVAERCLTGINAFGLPFKAFASELYRGFTTWAQDSGEKYASQMTQTAFGRAMRERGFDSVRGKNGQKMYTGIGIRSTAIAEQGTEEGK